MNPEADTRTTTLSEFLPVDYRGAFSPETAIIVDTFALDPSRAPDVAFVVPVFNQVARIRACLNSLVEHAELPAEIVVICDAATDGTEHEVLAWAADLARAPGVVVRLQVARLESSVFETLSDTIGFALSAAPTIVEVQADMVVQEPGFDRRLRQGLSRPDILAISGRGGHFLAAVGIPPRSRLRWRARRVVERVISAVVPRLPRYRPSVVEYLGSASIGRVGDRVNVPASASAGARLYRTESVMRGPLALDRARLEQVGGLDVDRFFLGDDDHDLAVRAWNGHRLAVGYLPLRFDSPLDAGSTRRERTPEEQREFTRLRDFYARARASSALVRGFTGAPPTRRVDRL